jgi:hypothetical protein
MNSTAAANNALNPTLDSAFPSLPLRSVVVKRGLARRYAS